MQVNFSAQQLYAAKSVSFGNLYSVSPSANDLKFQRVSEIYQDALKKHYSLPAFNFSNLENLQSIIAAAKNTNSPLIAQVSMGARKYAGQNYLIAMIQAAKKEADKNGVPIMLHLDHGDVETCKASVDAGFDSVMIDASNKSFEENIRLTKEVVDYAHAKGVFVEAELGKLAGVEDTVYSKESLYTDPEEAAEFVRRTGCDSLAISIGTSHGPNKFKEGEIPKLDFERLIAIKNSVEEILPENQGKRPWNSNWKQFPLVLHGASSAPVDLIEYINKNVVIPREKMEHLAMLQRAGITNSREARELWEDISSNHMKKVTGKGVPEQMYTQAVELGIAKLNVDTDFRLAYTGTIKEHMANNPAVIDPRDYGKAVKKALTGIGERKINMLQSDNKASRLQ